MAQYVCLGCGGSVSEEEYQAGKTTCGTDGCARQGQPFERREEGGEGAVPAAKTGRFANQ